MPRLYSIRRKMIRICCLFINMYIDVLVERRTHRNHHQRKVHAPKQPLPGHGPPTHLLLHIYTNDFILECLLACIVLIPPPGSRRGSGPADLPMQRDRQCHEAQDEELLQPDAAHVDVDAELDGVLRDVVAREHDRAGRLDDEGDNVEQDEEQAKPPGGDAGQAGGLCCLCPSWEVFC